MFYLISSHLLFHPILSHLISSPLILCHSISFYSILPHLIPSHPISSHPPKISRPFPVPPHYPPPIAFNRSSKSWPYDYQRRFRVYSRTAVKGMTLHSHAEGELVRGPEIGAEFVRWIRILVVLSSGQGPSPRLIREGQERDRALDAGRMSVFLG